MGREVAANGRQNRETKDKGDVEGSDHLKVQQGFEAHGNNCRKRNKGIVKADFNHAERHGEHVDLEGSKI